LTFQIINTVAQDKTLQITAPTERIGLQNLRRQLDLVYGEAYGFEISQNDGYFKAALTIDFHKTRINHEKDQVFAG
jgi:LytS/YehU family sensor histidine kinase